MNLVKPKNTKNLSNESYQKDELNIFNEFKSFNAESFVFKNEFNDKINEITSIQETIDPTLIPEKLTNKTNITESDINRLNESTNQAVNPEPAVESAAEATSTSVASSTGAVAGSSSAAAGSSAGAAVGATASTIVVGAVAVVVVLPAILIQNPTFSVDTFDIGTNSVHIVAEANDLAVEGNYVLELYNSQEKYTYDIIVDYPGLDTASSQVSPTEENQDIKSDTSTDNNVVKGYSYIDYTFNSLTTYTYYTMAFKDTSSETTFFSVSFNTKKSNPVTPKYDYSISNALINVSYDFDVTNLKNDFYLAYTYGEELYDIPYEVKDKHIIGELSLTKYDGVDFIFYKKTKKYESFNDLPSKDILYKNTFKVKDEDMINSVSLEKVFVSSGLQMEDAGQSNIPTIQLDMSINTLLKDSNSSVSVKANNKTYEIIDDKCVINDANYDLNKISVNIDDEVFDLSLEIPEVETNINFMEEDYFNLLTYNKADNTFNYYVDVFSLFDMLEFDGKTYKLTSNNESLEFKDEKIYIEGLTNSETIFIDRYENTGIYYLLTDRFIKQYEFNIDNSVTEAYSNGVYSLTFNKKPTFTSGQLDLTYVVKDEEDQTKSYDVSYDLANYNYGDSNKFEINYNNMYDIPTKIESNIIYIIELNLEYSIERYEEIFGKIVGETEISYEDSFNLNLARSLNVETPNIISYYDDYTKAVFVSFDNLYLNSNELLEVSIATEQNPEIVTNRYLEGGKDRIAYFDVDSTGSYIINYTLITGGVLDSDRELISYTSKGETTSQTINVLDMNQADKPSYTTGTQSLYFISTNNNGTYNVFLDFGFSVSNLMGYDDVAYSYAFGGSLDDYRSKFYSSNEVCYMYDVIKNIEMSRHLYIFARKDNVYYYISEYNQSGSIKYDDVSNNINNHSIDKETGEINIDLMNYFFYEDATLYVYGDGDVEMFNLDHTQNTYNFTTHLLNKTNYKFVIEGKVKLNAQEQDNYYGTSIENYTVFKGQPYEEVYKEFVPYSTSVDLDNDIQTTLLAEYYYDDLNNGNTKTLEMFIKFDFNFNREQFVLGRVYTDIEQASYDYEPYGNGYIVHILFEDLSLVSGAIPDVNILMTIMGNGVEIASRTEDNPLVITPSGTNSNCTPVEYTGSYLVTTNNPKNSYDSRTYNLYIDLGSGVNAVVYYKDVDHGNGPIAVAENGLVKIENFDDKLLTGRTYIFIYDDDHVVTNIYYLTPEITNLSYIDSNCFAGEYVENRFALSNSSYIWNLENVSFSIDGHQIDLEANPIEEDVGMPEIHRGTMTYYLPTDSTDPNYFVIEDEVEYIFTATVVWDTSNFDSYKEKFGEIKGSTSYNLRITGTTYFSA